MTAKVGATRQEQRYGELAAQLTACWTYERFRHRLERGESFAASDLPTSNLESIHAELRDVRERLGSEEWPQALDAIEHELRRSAAKLLAEDSRLGASDLRRFLTRVRQLDEEVLLGLLRFYVLAHRDESWQPEVVDKVDFLLSRLGEEISGVMLDRDLVRLRSALETLWRTAGSEAPGRSVLGALRRQVEGLRAELDDLPDLDGLEESAIIPRYRRLKHGLGRLLVEASVAEEVLRTNAALSRTVRRLHASEEWQIAADFAHLRDLEAEGGLPEALSLELESLRREMELYEEGRRWDDVRLETVHRLRRELQTLRPQIAELLPMVDEPPESATEVPAPAERDRADEPPEKAEPDPPEVRSVEAEPVAEVAEPRPAPRGVGESESLSDLRWELVRRLFQGLESVIEASSTLAEAEEILSDPGLPFDLEQRELEAFLGLRDGDGEEAVRDRLVFTAAAVRHRLGALRDALEGGAEGRVLRGARLSLRLAEALLDELEEARIEAEVAAEQSWVDSLRFLRVLLMREYAALWLEVRGAG